MPTPFFTLDYFKQVAAHLNRDPQFATETKDINTSLLLVCKDRNNAFRLTVLHGRTEVEEAAADSPAEFTFSGNYDAWVAAAKGEASLEKLVLAGKLKFAGSLTKIMYYQKRLQRIAEALRGIDKIF